MLAYLLSCATWAFSMDSTFCAHSLVARPHLSIRVCVSVCHILLLVYLFHLWICESLSTLLTLAYILHQIFVPLSSLNCTISLICVGVRNQQELLPIVLFPCPHWSDHWSTFNFGQGTCGIRSSLSPTHICSSLVMDRQGISSSVYNNNDEFDAMQNSTDAKMQAQM